MAGPAFSKSGAAEISLRGPVRFSGWLRPRERAVGDLGDLAAGGIGPDPERPVRVAADDAVVVRRLDVAIERITRRHVAEVRAPRRVDRPALCAHDDLTQLPARHVGPPAERPVRVAADDPVVVRRLDEAVERVAGRYIAEMRAPRRVDAPARPAHDDLGQLAARRVGVRPEAAVAVAAERPDA